MIAREYPNGVDCVWVASDCNGNVGAFVTGGLGPIPLMALNCEFVPVVDIEEIVCKLPKISDSHLLVSIKRPDDFIAMAERGFFVYDWRDIHRTTLESTHAYEPIAVPVSPILVDALSEPLHLCANNLRFRSVAFVDGQPLDVCVFVECINEKNGQKTGSDTK